MSSTLANPSSTTATSSSAARLSKEEIASAFSFLDVDKSGQITMANLRKRLGVFFPDMTSKEYRFLMGNRKEITVDDMHDFLTENEFTDPEFDPVAEAYKAYDTKQTGSINKERLREIFTTYHMGEADLLDEELDAILKLADLDGDGVVSMSDFKAVVAGQKMFEEGNAKTRAAAASSLPASDPETTA
jgi:calmodulin